VSNSVSSHHITRGSIVGVVVGLGACFCMTIGAQKSAGLNPVSPTASGQSLEPRLRALGAASLLPDESSAGYSSSVVVAEESASSLFKWDAGARDSISVSAPVVVEASPTQKFIEAGQQAPVLTPGDTVLLGVKDSFSLIAVGGWFTSAGYGQWMNSSPNYGTDRGAFGERLGAAAICNSSEDLLSESVMAPLLHEDPRYYRMGPRHNFILRLIYAGTRPIIARTNSGRTTPNFAVILGNAEGSALTNAYYPQVNRGMTQTMETLGLSIGGSAIADVLGEFYGDVKGMFHGRQP
jgi:hypothetical protein